MEFQELLIKITKVLNKARIPYIITGGYAVSVWGRPRSTFDIDVIIELPRDKIKVLAKDLEGVSKSGYVDEVSMESAVKEKGEFNFIHADSGLKIDFWVLKDKDPFDISRLKRKKAKLISGEKIYFSSPEDLILSKLKWNKESQSARHLEDVRSVLKVSGKKLDMKYLKSWGERLGVLKELNRLMKE